MVDVNQSFGLGQNAVGVNTGILGTIYTPVTSGVSTITLNGSFTNPGDPVSANINTAGLLANGATAAYQGFTTNPDGHITYFFSATGGGLTSAVPFAVSGDAIPGVVNANAIQPGPAPADPFIVACYASGTMIRTLRGDIAVEDLRIGDEIVTATGVTRPLIWLGNRQIDCTRHPEPAKVRPYRVQAGAFGEGLPSRDLYLSPDHHIAVTSVDTLFMKVAALANGATIAQVPVETVTYWHVELPEHAVIFANDLPSESYYETGNRSAFENGVAHCDLFPDFASSRPGLFRHPLIEGGPVLAGVRSRLLARAEAMGWTRTCEADLKVLADGVEIRGSQRGDLVRFAIPASTADLRIASRSFAASEIVPESFETRRLGVQIESLSVLDGLSLSGPVPLDSLEATGLYAAEEANGLRWRWTDGAARLAPSLWQGCEDVFFLQLKLIPLDFPFWAAPAGEEADQQNQRAA